MFDDLSYIMGFQKGKESGGGGGDGVKDVKIDGTSVVTSGVANIPKAQSNTQLGVIKLLYSGGSGLRLSQNGELSVDGAGVSNIRGGTDSFRPVTPEHLDAAAFYGLARAAGDTTQKASSNPVGTYTDEAKAKVKQMLDIPEGGGVSDVKVNGVSVVDGGVASIVMPVDTSDLTNDGDGTSPFATQEYVDANAGKIDSIKLNGVAQTITNRGVSLIVPTVEKTQSLNKVTICDGPDAENGMAFELKRDTVSPYSPTGLYVDVIQNGASAFGVMMPSLIYTDKKYRTEAQVQQAIDDALSSYTTIDFQIVASLPATGEKGVIYLVETDPGVHGKYNEYIWVTPTGGTAHYEPLGAMLDLADYWSKAELTAMTDAEIDEILV